jgi:hypothetical protein
MFKNKLIQTDTYVRLIFYIADLERNRIVCLSVKEEQCH